MPSVINPYNDKPINVRVAELSDGAGGRTEDSTPDNLTLIVDPLVPEKWWPLFALHESTEAREMEDGASYDAAHRKATKAEREYCKSHDIDFDEYDLKYHEILRKIKSRDPRAKDPEDLFHGDAGEIQKAAAKFPVNRIKAEDSSISRVKKLFQTSVEGAAAKTAWDDVASLVESKAALEEILDEIEWPEYAPEAELEGLYLTIGKIQADHIADIVRAKAFKPRSRAAEWLSKFGAEEIKYIDDSQKEAIRNILARCYEDESHHRMAWEIKSYIGLDPGRAETLQTYANDLMAQELPEKAAWGLTEVRGEELLMDRAMAIASNECLTASRRASADVTAEAVDREILNPDEQEGVWLTVADQPGMGDDGHICDECRAAGGSTRELPDGVYEASGTQYTDLHIGCRCIEGIQQKVKKSLDYSNIMVPRLDGEISVAYRPEGDDIPYPNFHSTRVADPGDFEEDSFRNKELPNSKGVQLIMGKRKGGKGSMEAQAYRFPKDEYTPEEAKQWLKDNDVKDYTFEPAEDEVEKAIIAFLKADTCVSEKIKECMADGTPQDQAVAIAMRECGMSQKAVSKTDLTPEYLRAHYDAVKAHGSIHPQVKDDIHNKAKAAAGGKLRSREKPGGEVDGETLDEEEIEAEVSGLKKCDGTTCEIEKFMPIVKVDEKEGKVYCVVAEPGFDLQGDYSTGKEIAKSAHRFMEMLQKTCGPGVGVHHERPIKAYVIENVVTQQPDIKLGDQVLKQGTWYQGHDLREEPEILKDVIAGTITGLSRQGRGRRVPITGTGLTKATAIAKSAGIENTELNYLLDEEIERVDWVGKGANGRKIAIIKFDLDSETMVKETKPAGADGSGAGAGEAQVTIAKADLETIQKSLEELTKENAALKETAKGKDDVEKIAKAALQRVEVLETQARQERIEKSIGDLTLPGAKRAEIIALLKSVEDKLGLDSAELKTLRGILEGVSAITEKSPLFKSLGTEGEGSEESSPVAKFAALVDKEMESIRKDAENGGKSRAVLEALATKKVSEMHPELLAEIYSAGSEVLGGV